MTRSVCSLVLIGLSLPFASIAMSAEDALQQARQDIQSAYDAGQRKIAILHWPLGCVRLVSGNYGFPSAIITLMKITLVVLSIILPLLAFVSSGSAEPPQTATIKAPLLGNSQTTDNRDLGTWDDVFVCDERDFMVVRRGELMFSLSMTDAGNPKKLVALPALKKAVLLPAPVRVKASGCFSNRAKLSRLPLRLIAAKCRTSAFHVQRFSKTVARPSNHKLSSVSLMQLY